MAQISTTSLHRRVSAGCLKSHLIGLHTCRIAILMDAVGSCSLLATQNRGTGAVCRPASGLADCHSGRSSLLLACILVKVKRSASKIQQHSNVISLSTAHYNTKPRSIPWLLHPHRV